LKINPTPPFTREVISSMLSQITSAEWKCDPDELKSAKIILEEFEHAKPDPATGKKSLYSIQSIVLLACLACTQETTCHPTSNAGTL
jgi:hypothetical protein